MFCLSLKPPTCKFLDPKRFQCCNKPEPHQETERGLTFDVGDSFFRRESSTGRDLGVLSAAVYKKKNNALKVLDAMCGCGVRSLRYLTQSKADFVLANDANPDYAEVIARNLERGQVGDDNWEVKCCEATRVLMECCLKREFYDLIDVDSFGSDSTYLRSAMSAVKLDGLLYVTSTDGFSSGGHRPQHTLAAYGSYIRHMPYSNEIGLRMLVGGALREALVLGYHVVPLFSYYSYHGPVFRVMLQVRRGKYPVERHYKFISYCTKCGNSKAFSWHQLGEMRCSCNDVPGSLIVSGPLWTGPLHSSTFLTEILNLAGEWGWTGNGEGKHLETLIKLMIDESDPMLPFGYHKMDEIASRAKVNSPRIDAVLLALHQEGYAVARSHIVSNAIKTNCSMVECVRLVREIQQRSAAADGKSYQAI